jgi:hypothetical protein
MTARPVNEAERGLHDSLYGEVSTFDAQVNSGENLRFEVDERGNVAVWVWDITFNRWNQIWGRIVWQPGMQ